MSASLVGSEMCIRDSPYAVRGLPYAVREACALRTGLRTAHGRPCTAYGRPVSYTHLTLPTICSV
eukprot:8617359-Alexandrium_andersonii.AAC.1